MCVRLYCGSGSTRRAHIQHSIPQHKHDDDTLRVSPLQQGTSPTGRCCDCAANARSFWGNQLLASRALPCSGWPAISHLLRLFGRLFLGDRPQLRRGDVRNRPPCGRGFLGLTLQSQQPTSNTFDLFEEVLLPQVVWIFAVNIRYGCEYGCGRGLTCCSGITGKSEALPLGCACR